MLTAERSGPAGDPLIDIGPVQPDEMAWVFSSWLKSYRRADMVREIGSDVFYTYHHRLIERLLDRGAKIDVARAEGLIVGWTCTEGPVLHYVHVKLPYQKCGVADRLLRGHELRWATHSTRAGQRLMVKFRLTFNPYLV